MPTPVQAAQAAYWDALLQNDPEVWPLREALKHVFSEWPTPTWEQQRRLFMSLPEDVFGQVIQWGMRDTEVREAVLLYTQAQSEILNRLLKAP